MNEPEFKEFVWQHKALITYVIVVITLTFILVLAEFLR